MKNQEKWSSYLLIVIILLIFNCCSSARFIKVADKKLLHRNYEKAEELYEKALIKDSDNDKAYLGIGNCKYTLGEYNDAVTNYKIVFDKRDAQYYNCAYSTELSQLGEALFHLRRYSEALPIFTYLQNNCKKSSNKLGECHYFIGRDFFYGRDYKSALSHFDATEKLLNFNGAPLRRDTFYQLFASLYLNLAAHSFQQKDFVNSERYWGKISKYSPFLSGSFVSQFLIGRVYNELKKYQEAFDTFQKLYDLKSSISTSDFEQVKSEYSSASYNLAKFEYSKNSFSRSLEYLHTAERVDTYISQNPEAILLKANCFFSLKRYLEAIKEYEKSNLKKPLTQIAKNNWSEAEFFVGKSFFDKNQFDESWFYFNRSLQKIQASSRVYHELLLWLGVSETKKGDFFCERKNFSQALKWYGQAKNNIKNSAYHDKQEYLSEIYFKLARTYELMQKISPALAHYDTISKSFKFTGYFEQACYRGLDLAEKTQEWRMAIRFALALADYKNNDEEKHHYHYRLASLYSKAREKENCMRMLFRLYESSSYNDYINLVTNNASFSLVSSDARFIRWQNKIRRIKLTVQSAYLSAFDQMGENDLTVVLLDPNGEVLLSTENIENKNNVIFRSKEVVFDYKIGNTITFMLIDNDYPDPPETYIFKYESISKTGKGQLIESKGDFGDFFGKWHAKIYYVANDSEDRLWSDNVVVPKTALNGNRNDICFLSCAAQSLIGYATKHPILTGLVSELIASWTNNSNYSVKNAGAESFKNYFSDGLKNTGNHNYLNLFEGWRFFDCVSGCKGVKTNSLIKK